MGAVPQFRGWILGLAAAGGLLASAAAQDARPDVDQEMKASCRAAFAYQPVPADAPAPKPAADIVLLRRVIVRNRWESRGLDQAIARQNAIDDRFTLFNGGALAAEDLGRAQVAVGTWFNPDPTAPTRPVPGLNLLKLSY